MKFLNLVLIVGVCFAYHNIATIRAEKEAKIAAENSGLGSWKDGTYEGSGQGFGGQIVVSVHKTKYKFLIIFLYFLKCS